VTKPIRVLVVEDSLTIRKHLVEVLSEDPGLQVVGEAEDGKQAIELCERLRPDVVTLDMMMPVMSGVAATEHIMAYFPTPILVVSASTNRGEVYRTYDALAAGAIDVLDKPRAAERDEAWNERLRSTVKLISRIKVITHLRARLGGATSRAAGTPAPLLPARTASAPATRAIALGGSTGSPGAVLQILRGLPVGYPLPVLLVVHINEPFGRAFAEWLDAQLSVRVRYAHDGEPLGGARDATVLMAPPGRHLVVERGLLRLDDGPERYSCRPSVDVLFHALARDLGAAALGCLLTGMGRDGAEGLLAMRQAGAATVAQDEASCVVFGMPREAILLGAAERVLPLDEIGPALLEVARRARSLP
jgi:two-component system, chemotaxis family, protein-glutamate methylesterase/glutaminase